MSALLMTEPLSGLLKDLAYRDVNDLIRDTVITEILAKISNFRQEVAYFEQKYSQIFGAFQAAYESGPEDFAQYDDLLAWEFAQQGYDFWQKRLADARHVL